MLVSDFRGFGDITTTDVSAPAPVFSSVARDITVSVITGVITWMLTRTLDKKLKAAHR